MRWHIVRTLLKKEWHRQLANRSGLALALLLVAAAALLSIFSPGVAERGKSPSNITGFASGVHHCYIDYDERSPLVRQLADHLENNRPQEIANHIIVRPLKQADVIDGIITYQSGTGALQLRMTEKADAERILHVLVWHPRDDPNALAPYEAWLWREIRRFFIKLAQNADRSGQLSLESPDEDNNDWLLFEAHEHFRQRIITQLNTGLATNLIPSLAVERQGLGGKALDVRAGIATALVMFALWLTCVYLMPMFTCEEKERGVLLAQALSPASPGEIVASKFLFYPVMGMGLAAVLAGLYRLDVLSTPFFWLALFSVGAAFLGLGMVITALARTQRAAFLGGMCYLLSVSVFLLICSQNNLTLLSNLTIEYHGPRILHAALSEDVNPTHWIHFGLESLLASVWLFSAGWLFRRRGWQQ